ncbi:MAG TPA: lanthionine synthetase C family protein [Ktedonobacteraceae bacterium]|nr:lanthionine synthetase C family protein [Ktedonobacteraceae bacterium]
MKKQTHVVSESIQPTPGKLRYESHLASMRVCWKSTLDEPLRRRAQETACSVAERMRNPDFVRAMAKRISYQTDYSATWSSFSLSFGDLGIALMYDYMDKCLPGQSWHLLAQRYLDTAISGSQRFIFSSPALYNGTSSLAIFLSLTGKEGQGYQKLLAHLYQGLCKQILTQTWRPPSSEGGVADRDYDIISGAAGVLSYLISIEQPDEVILTAVGHILHYLTWLAEPGQPVGKERWYIPSALLPTERHRAATPGGHFNCGLAHGIPGPLAALALTWLAGYQYAGLRESIAYLANWVIEHHVDVPWGIDWPDSIPLECASLKQYWQSLPPARAAWCYGSPGISRSLWLAGQALEDEHIRQVAIDAIESALRRPIASRSIPSPHLCHGVAGLLQICLHFAHECESMLVREQIPRLVQQLLDAFEPDSALGFCNRDEGKPLDQPSWLTGTPGVVMALLAASTSVAPTWDRILVIA